jgi:TonB family protein
MDSVIGADGGWDKRDGHMRSDISEASLGRPHLKVGQLPSRRAHAIVEHMQNPASKSRLLSRAFSSFLLLALCVPSYFLQGQGPVAPAPSAAVVEMPRDPNELMSLAAQLNGLSGDDIKPWHLKASYAVTDGQGATTEQGLFEEFWAGPHKIRTIYTVGADSQTAYVTDNGAFEVGSLAQPSGLMSDAAREYVAPLPAQDYLQRVQFEMHSQKAGESKLSCVQEKSDPSFHRIGPATSMFCFSLDKPILRIDAYASGGRQAVRNAIVIFQGRYVPKDIRILMQDKTSLTTHLESLEEIATIADSDFTPPADAKPVERKVAISTGVAQRLLLKEVPPHYPVQALSAHVSGTVTIRVRIGKDGHVYDPKIVSGPLMLQQAALDAVKDWVYRPYMLNGEAVEVDTILNINFNLGR